MPASEVDIDSELVARLVSAQLPGLAGQTVHSPVSGWDNVVFRLGEDLAVRLPRREVAVELAVNEHRWLPEFAARVRLPIPVPLHVGEPDHGYPWTWSVIPWIEGISLTESPARGRGDVARSLAGFITELHVPAPDDAPHNPFRGVPLADRAGVLEERLGTGLIPRSDELLRLWHELIRAEVWKGAPVWLHGDLHPGNLLVSDGNLSGVIDFGDLAAGDPATDLAVGWLAFDAEDRAVFEAELPSAYRDDATLRTRSKGWALLLATAYAAHSDDNPTMADVGRHAIAQLLNT